MKVTKYLLMIFILTISRSHCRTWQKYFEPIQLTGQWRQFSVMSPIGPCQPCQYKLSFDNSDAKFEISNSKNYSKVFQYNLNRMIDQNQIVFLDRTIKYKSDQPDTALSVRIQSKPMDGIAYQYIIQFKDIGLYIDSSQKLNDYSIMVNTAIFITILWACAPLHKKQIEKSMIQLHKRTCLFSLSLYAQLIATITAVQGILVVEYVFNSQSYFQKILCYCLMGFSFLSCMIHLTFTLAITQKKLNDFLLRDSIYKCSITFLALFVAIIMYPLIIITFHKGTWYFYFMMIGLVVQFLISINMKMLPFHKFIIMYSVMIIYLAFQMDDYPILNFSQISYFQQTILLIVLGIVNLSGAWALRNTGNLQNIAAMFRSNNYESKRQGSTTNTQNQKEIDQSRQGPRKMQQIKSDYELQPIDD